MESPKNNVYISILSKNILPIENHFLNNAFITNMICSVIENICNVKTQKKIVKMLCILQVGQLKK